MSNTELPNLPPCPWDDLKPDGENLRVHDFLTAMFSHTSNGLRRAITVPYTDQFDLSVSEWRILSVLADSGTLAFTDLVTQAAADKAQVSRTVRLLEERGWLRVQADGPSNRKKLACVLTSEGQAFYEQVIPVARSSQAAMILRLAPQERRVLFYALGKLRTWCETPVEGKPPGANDNSPLFGHIALPPDHPVGSTLHEETGHQ